MGQAGSCVNCCSGTQACEDVDSYKKDVNIVLVEKIKTNTDLIVLAVRMKILMNRSTVIQKELENLLNDILLVQK
jgi:hypothetical protein